LSLLVTFHLLKTQPSLKLSGLLLHFGCYDLSELPQARHFSKPLVLDLEIMDHFIKAFVPGMSVEERKDPSVSPFYEDIEKLRGKLPSALFTCGTEDPLLDDSMFMATKWLMTGGEAIVKIYPGAAHGFIAFPTSMLKESGEALQDTATYIRDRLAKS
jgi:acetyl esterase/lipase